MKLPHTHTATAHIEYDSGGWHVVFYADEDGASGLGIKPLEQRWYGPRDECIKRVNSKVFPLNGWNHLNGYDGPDRTDPGYHLDNF